MGQVHTLDLFQVMDDADSHFPQEHGALVDNLSQVTTTNKKFLLHDFKPITSPRLLKDARKKAQYVIKGQGTLLVPRGDGSYMRIKCWYTPSLPVTVISPGEHFQQHPSQFESHTIFSHEYKGTGEVRFHSVSEDNDDIFLTQYFKKKSVTKGLLPVPSSTPYPKSTVNALTEEGT